MKNQLKMNLMNIDYLFKQALACDKMLMPLMLLTMVIEAILPFLVVVFPKYIIDELTIGKSMEKAMMWVFLFIGSNFFLKVLNTVIDGIVNSKKEILIQQHYKSFSDKTMSMDIEKIENPQISDQKDRAQRMITWNSRNIDGIKNALGGMIAYSLQVIGFAYVLFQFNFAIVLLIIVVILVNSLLNKKSQKLEWEMNRDMTPIHRKGSYLGKISDDYSYGKMIRLYHVAPFIINKYVRNREEYKENQSKLLQNNFKHKSIVSIISTLQEGVIYIFLINSVVSKKITLGEFTMYLAATMAFTDAIIHMIEFVISMNYTSQYVKEYIDFLELPDHLDKSGCKAVPRENHVFEFKKVSYRYPFAKMDILKDLNVVIRCNEKISLVGDNGAGKTTFVKLLMRLMDPTEGVITLNGLDIKEYDYKEYMSVFSTVFQDYQMFSFTIGENIAFGKMEQEENRIEINQALEKAGILEKVKGLPEQIHTYLGKGFVDNGIELSGGESQKIAIARSVFKDGTTFVMDEPTASLSPLAEYEIFRNFNDSTTKKSVLFVSHRLSNIMFSDTILVFQDGRIVEKGGHQDLINSGGLYHTMFRMQSSYYNKDEVKMI